MNEMNLAVRISRIKDLSERCLNDWIKWMKNIKTSCSPTHYPTFSQTWDWNKSFKRLE